MGVIAKAQRTLKGLVSSRDGRQAASSSSHHLIARKVMYDWQSTPIDWLHDEPFTSQFVNTMHLLLPGGEFWMCRMLNKALPDITDPKLREDVQLFIRQEAMHARAHGGAAEQHLRAYGLYPEHYMQQVNWLYESLLGDAPLGMTLPKALNKSWLTFRLGIMAALEHLTCILGQYALEHKRWEEHGADPTTLDLLRWHGAEEIEHRSVVFDAYRDVGGHYPGRLLPAVVMFVLVIGLWIHGSSHILRQHPAVRANPSPLRPWFWLQWQRASARGFIPHPLWLAFQMTSYFKPGYNPVHEGSTEQALAYLATSAGYLAAQQQAATA